jgi:hypothetical protein
MRFATLICWLVTAGLGGFMLRTWIARGGLRRERARAGGLPPQLIFGHAVGAVAGLLAWVGYLASGAQPFAWTAVGLLMLTVGLGLSTVTLWTPYPARRPGERRPVSWGAHELVIPDTPAAAVEAVAAADARTADSAAGEARTDPVSLEVTDELITRLLSEPMASRRQSAIRINPAVLVPVAHGFAAIGTFVLAVTSAIK